VPHQTKGTPFESLFLPAFHAFRADRQKVQKMCAQKNQAASLSHRKKALSHSEMHLSAPHAAGVAFALLFQVCAQTAAARLPTRSGVAQKEPLHLPQRNETRRIDKDPFYLSASCDAPLVRDKHPDS
jgi:hypothetical protein